MVNMVNMRDDGTAKPPVEDIAVPPIHSGEPDDLTFLEILLIVTQRKKLVGMVTVVGTAIAMLLAFALPQEYTATVTILPPQENSSNAMPARTSERVGKVESETTSSTPGVKNANDMYVSLLKSRSVEDAVIQHYALQLEYRKTSQGETRKTFEKHIQIDGSNKDGLIRLNFSDRDPNRAAEVANEYIDQLRNLAERLELAKLDETREGAFIQIVDSAVPPEEKSFPKRNLFLIAGVVVGFTFGIMLALLQGGLVRMQRNPVTKEKLDLLKRSLFGGHTARPKQSKEEVTTLPHARSEATR